MSGLTEIGKRRKLLELTIRKAADVTEYPGDIETLSKCDCAISDRSFQPITTTGKIPEVCGWQKQFPFARAIGGTEPETTDQ